METTADIKRIASDIEARVRPEIEGAQRRLESLGRKATTTIKENPAKCVLGAIAVGYLIGKVASR